MYKDTQVKRNFMSKLPIDIISYERPILIDLVNEQYIIIIEKANYEKIIVQMGQ